MPLTLNIESGSAKLELPNTTVKHYRFDYAESDNYAKGNTDLIRLNVTVDVMEILSLAGATKDNQKLVQDIRDWSKLIYTDKDSYEEYYRKVTLKNYVSEEEVRTLVLRHAYVNKSTESFDPLKGNHTITLELLQKGDVLDHAGTK